MASSGKPGFYWLRAFGLTAFLFLPAAAAVCGTFTPPEPRRGQDPSPDMKAAAEPVDAGPARIVADLINPVSPVAEGPVVDDGERPGDPPAAQGAGGEQGTVVEPEIAPDVEGGASDEPAAIRDGLLEVLATYHAIAATRQMEAVEVITLDAQDRVLAMSTEDLMVFAEARPALWRLRDAVGELAAVQAAPLQSATDAGRSAGFPDAAYSALCGSDRNDTAAVFAAKVALQAARLVWSAASRACDEVVVVLGEGGNTSLVCIAADATLFAAEAVLEDFIFCDDDINAAEIEGSYERLFHLHGDVEVLQERVDEIWEREIEENIFHRNNLVSLFLPAAHGGRLESVRDIVQKWITQAAAAGMDVTRAECFFQQGLQHFDNNRYKAAFRSFSRAYRELTKGDDSDDSHDEGCDDSADDSADNGNAS